MVSLPRTGTTSITKMMEICGLEGKHCPFTYFEHYLNNDRYDFYSDTPVYIPSVVEKLCKRDDVKFIYVERPYDKIFESWVNYGLFRTFHQMIIEKDNGVISDGRLFDFNSYYESFSNTILTSDNYSEVFESHKEKVISIIKKHDKELLIYNFNDGWKPFCDFLGVEIPNEEIPKLNYSNK